MKNYRIYKIENDKIENWFDDCSICAINLFEAFKYWVELEEFDAAKIANYNECNLLENIKIKCINENCFYIEVDKNLQLLIMQSNKEEFSF